MRSQTKSSLLVSFIVSIALCGVVGIYCLLCARIGWIEEKILGTTAAIGGASLMGLASAAAWERHRWHPIGPAGIMAAAAALALILVGIWLEPSWRNEIFWKTMAVACVAGVALPTLGLLSTARLRREYGWVRRVTVMVVTILAGQIAFTFIAEVDDEVWGRMMGILAIASVCGVIAVPILHRVSALRTTEEVRTFESTLSLTCPRCKTVQDLPTGRARCRECKLRINIEIEEEQCRSCGYPLYRLTSDVCPECGTPLTA